MATTSRNDFDGADMHQRAYDLAASYKALISRMANGEMIKDAPWTDPRFQEMVNRELSRHGEWKRDSEKLAVVKEIFGGAR